MIKVLACRDASNTKLYGVWWLSNAPTDYPWVWHRFAAPDVTDDVVATIQGRLDVRGPRATWDEFVESLLGGLPYSYWWDLFEVRDQASPEEIFITAAG